MKDYSIFQDCIELHGESGNFLYERRVGDFGYKVYQEIWDIFGRANWEFIGRLSHRSGESHVRLYKRTVETLYRGERI